ncbi:MAG: response regulator [Deltaproteobacteria bacterium]|nr:response regulator [Deltaproteobacteria bacterium]
MRGLQICTVSGQLVERMGASIWAESGPGQGATFFFRVDLQVSPGSGAEDPPDVGGHRDTGVLVVDDSDTNRIGTQVVKPLRRKELLHAMRTGLGCGWAGAPCEAPSRGGTGGERRDSEPLRILVAEDDRLNSALTLMLLEKRGWRGVPVRTGREAVEAFFSGDYDAVLMDVQMPELDGVGAAKEIRAREARDEQDSSGGGRGRAVIIGVTADAMKGDRERCLEAGMDEYLPKPVEPETLYAAIERHRSATRA